MFSEAGLLFLYAETPLHAGSGPGVGDVDLAIQREKHTGYPFIQAAGVKGAMRDLAAQRGFKHIQPLFGPEPGGPPRLAGVLSFTEARLLLFPVWSLVGVFAWITCPAVLKRFCNDLSLVNPGVAKTLEGVSRLEPDPNQAMVPEGTNLATTDGSIHLPDLDLKAKIDSNVGHFATILAHHALPQASSYWTTKLSTDLVLLDDEYFRDFVEHETEVISRVHIGTTGTVAEGPWEEEYLPAETLLYSLVLTADPRLRPADSAGLPAELQGGPTAVLDYLKAHLDNATHAQIGGNQTLGRGLVSVRFHRAGDLIIDEPGTSRRTEEKA